MVRCDGLRLCACTCTDLPPGVAIVTSRETPGASVQYLRLGPKRPVMETSDLALECGEMLPWIQVTAAGNPSTPQTFHSPKCPGRYAQLKYFPNICGGCQDATTE